MKSNFIFIGALFALVSFAAAGVGNFAGGARVLSPAEVEAEQAVLQSSLDKLDYGDSPKLAIVKCHSGTSQVVAGSLVKLNCDMEYPTGQQVRCTMSLWSQPWLEVNGYQVESVCDDKTKRLHRHSRSVEDEAPVQIVGGPRVLSPAEVEAKQAVLQSSLEKIVDGDAPKMTIVKCHSGTTQVVAGSLLKLNCDMEYPTGLQVPCTMTLFSQPWTKRNEVTFECDGEEKRSHRLRRSAEEDFPSFGGLTPLNADELKEAVAELSSSLSKLKGGDVPSLKIKECTSGTTQVVAGTSLKLNCNMIDENNKVVKCLLSLWSQPWLTENGYEVEYKCENGLASKHRHSRSAEPQMMPGGSWELDAKALAEEKEIFAKSFAALATRSDGPSYTIVDVISGTERIAAGPVVDLKVVLLNKKTGKEEKCDCKLWSQPWLTTENNEMTIKCEGKPEAVHRFSL